MKKFTLVILFFSLFFSAQSQSPQGLNYQAVVRDSNGAIRPFQTIQFNFEILNAAGISVYSEAQIVTTNSYGLADGIIIGKGYTTDDFSNINWGAGTYFLNVKIDGEDMGSKQLLSVPYALYALKSGSGGGGSDGVGIQSTVDNNDGTFTIYYTNGTSFTTSDFSGDPGNDGNDGLDGKSAYQSWLDQGNTGSEADFIQYFVGPQGEKGDKGEKGDPGEDFIITGGASSVISNNLDTSRVLVSNIAGKISVSGISSPELETLDNIESNIQNQINNKQDLNDNLTVISSMDPSNGSFIVGDGTIFSLESDSLARNSLGLGSISTQDSGSVYITGGDIIGITDLSISDGGTGASTAAQARLNLDVDVAGTDNSVDVTLTDVPSNYLTITGQEITSATVPIELGGTGGTSAVAARSNLELGTIATQDNYNVNITGGNINGITDLKVVDGGTGASTPGLARSNLGLGSISVQNSNNINITGGNITGITDLAILDGGTGASNKSDARTNLGLVIGTDVQPYDEDLADIASLTPNSNNFIVGDGDKFVQKSASEARSSLGLGSLALQNVNGVLINGGSITGITDLAVSDGGTGASTPAQARINLGINLGTDIQPFDQELAAIAALVSAENKGIQFTGDGTASTFTLSDVALEFLDDDSDSLQRVTLGLGNISVQNTDSIQITGGTISGITDLAISDGGTGASTADSARINLGINIGVNVQGYDLGLKSIADLVTEPDQMIYTDSPSNYVTTDLTSAARELLNDSTPDQMRQTLDFSLENLGLTASADEINILDSATLTTSELNILDGVTASADEINILDGLNTTTAELNLISGLSAGSAEINVLDGVNISTYEINFLDNIQSNVQSQLDNKQDKISNVSTDELEALDNIQSNIQSQLDGKEFTIVGAASSITTDNLELSRAVISNNLGKIDTSAVTSSELNVLSGISSNTQELNILTGATVTSSELNLLDGSNSVDSTIIISSSDGIIVNDNGEMKSIPFSDVSAFVNDNISLNDLSDVSIINSDLNQENAQSIYIGNIPTADEGSAVANIALSSNSLNKITVGDYNVAIGWGALKENISGRSNIAIGPMALRDNTSDTGNVAIGFQSMLDASGASYNTAIGFKSMKGTDDNNITGDFNTAFGSGTLELIISGQKNTAIGSNAMKNNVGGSQNTIIGYNSGNNISTGGDNNTAIGSSSLYNNIIGNENVALGGSSLYTNKSNYNTAIGYNSLYSLNSSKNIGIGWKAGDGITSGSDNIIIGYDASAGSITGNNQIVIGSSAIGKGPNTVTLGNGDILGWYPSDNNEVDLGGQNLKFRNFYLEGSAYLDTTFVSSILTIGSGEDEFSISENLDNIEVKNNIKDKDIIFTIKDDTVVNEIIRLDASESKFVVSSNNLSFGNGENITNLVDGEILIDGDISIGLHLIALPILLLTSYFIYRRIVRMRNKIILWY